MLRKSRWVFAVMFVLMCGAASADEGINFNFQRVDLGAVSRCSREGSGVTPFLGHALQDTMISK